MRIKQTGHLYNNLATGFGNLIYTNKLHDARFKYLGNLRGYSAEQLEERAEFIVSYDGGNKTPARNPAEREKYLGYALTAETPNGSLNNPEQGGAIDKRHTCVICNMDYNTAKSCNAHIRDEDICPVYFRFDAFTPK